MVKLLCIGDWGKKGSLLDNVSGSMNSVCASGVIFLGDNFYEFGVRSVDDPLWDEVFRSKFRADRHYNPVLGNHDYMLNPMAQVSFKGHGWDMPNSYYKKVFGDGRLVMLFIDTVELAPQSSLWNGVNPFRLASSEAQWKWIEESLAEARVSPRTKWITVIGHYPIFSNGQHGSTPELVDRLNPLLVKYGVHMYVCGHEHNFQHLSASGITYIVCGSGSKTGHHVHKGGDKLLWSSQEGGFLELEFGYETIEGVFRDQTNRPLYVFRI